MKLYKKVRKAYDSKCGGKYNVGEADRKIGILTIEQKLERECPGYSRMDQLYGSRQNVNPHYTVDGDVSNDDDDDDDDADDDNDDHGDDNDDHDDQLDELADEGSQKTMNTEDILGHIVFFYQNHILSYKK